MKLALLALLAAAALAACIHRGPPARFDTPNEPDAGTELRWG